MQVQLTACQWIGWASPLLRSRNSDHQGRVVMHPVHSFRAPQELFDVRCSLLESSTLLVYCMKSINGSYHEELTNQMGEIAFRQGRLRNRGFLAHLGSWEHLFLYVFQPHSLNLSLYARVLSFYSVMSCDAWKSRGCGSAWLTRLQIRAPSASVAELPQVVFFEPDTASQSHPWHPSISWSWQAEGVEKGTYERNRHACACDARSLKRVVGSSNTHFRFSRIAVLSSWEWGLSYKFFLLSPLRVFVGVSCRFALPHSVLKVQFLTLSHHVDSCSPLLPTPQFESAELQATTIHKPSVS